MKYTKTCPCCDHKISAYSYCLNGGLCKALSQLVGFYEHKRARAKLSDLHLTNAQYSNFAHLAYFGLAHRDEDGWVPTAKGSDFVNEVGSCEDMVAVMSKEVLPIDHEAWKTSHERPRYVMFSDIICNTYKQRKAFQEEKGSTNPQLFNPSTYA